MFICLCVQFGCPALICACLFCEPATSLLELLRLWAYENAISNGKAAIPLQSTHVLGQYNQLMVRHVRGDSWLVSCPVGHCFKSDLRVRACVRACVSLILASVSATENWSNNFWRLRKQVWNTEFRARFHRNQECETFRNFEIFRAHNFWLEGNATLSLS